MLFFDLSLNCSRHRSTASVDETRPTMRSSSPIVRDVHSEGESESLAAAGSAGDDPAAAHLDPEVKMAISSIGRLKRLSIKRWKVFR